MRLIDAYALKDIFYRYKKYGLDDEEERTHNAAIDQCIVALNAAQEANVPHGYWIDRPLIKLGKLSNVPVVECSRCGITFCDVINNHHTMYRFCPFCGAKQMEKEIISIQHEINCPWCKNGKRNRCEFSVLDEQFGQFVHQNMVKFCPFCGAKMNSEVADDAGI